MIFVCAEFFYLLQLNKYKNNLVIDEIHSCIQMQMYSVQSSSILFGSKHK